MQRPTGRHAAPPRPGKKNTKLMIFGIGGGVVLLIIIIVAMNAPDPKKKNGGKPDATANAGGTPSTPANPVNPPRPPDDDLHLQAPNMEAIKSERAALEQRAKAWSDAHWTPLNGDVLKVTPDGEKELNALCDAWETFVHKLQGMDFTNDQAKIIMPPCKLSWQTVRDHRDEIALARRKAGQTPPK